MATIKEALTAINPYPIPSTSIDIILIDNGLDGATVYDAVIGASQAYELAKADAWVFLHDSPSIVEQEVGVNNAIRIKENMLERANAIYAKYDSDKFRGQRFGFIGENYNG